MVRSGSGVGSGGGGEWWGVGVGWGGMRVGMVGGGVVRNRSGVRRVGW